MTYARIHRGEMAADVLQRDFTQIHNRLFRDPRLSFKAKGIFGLISTHRDGYGVSAEWIAAASTDGVAAVKTGLRELEKYGYLEREQVRNPDGTRGAMTYKITDMPSSEPQVENRPPVATCGDMENRRSEPASENPPADEPPAADRTHKKISSKKTTGKNTNPPPTPPAAPAAPAPAARGREGGRGAALTDEERTAAEVLARAVAGVPQLVLGEREIARLAPLVVPWLGRASLEQLRQALTAGLPAEVGSAVGLVRRRLLEKLPPAAVPPPARPELPPWCGRCGEGNPAAQFNPRFRRTADSARCPDCHPDAAPADAA